MIHSLKTFKNAQLYLKDLDFLIEIIEVQINKYKGYNNYTSVKRIISTLQEELGILKANRDKCRQIIENKGKLNE